MAFNADMIDRKLDEIERRLQHAVENTSALLALTAALNAGQLGAPFKPANLTEAVERVVAELEALRDDQTSLMHERDEARAKWQAAEEALKG